jgi:arsenate reductase
MAAAFFNLFANPELARAFSAGTAPVAHVHPEVVRVMREEGIDLAAYQPQKLTPELVGVASTMITIGCGEDWPPVPELERLDWPIDDPRAKDIPTVRAIRDEIKQHILTLLRERSLIKDLLPPATIDFE